VPKAGAQKISKMVNKRFLQTAERWKNPSLPKEKIERVKIKTQNSVFPDLPNESFIFSYDGPHKDFFQELITKNNKVYSGTNAKIPTGTSGEIQGNLIKRMGLISTIANDSNLRSYNLWPITATQSEYLLQAGKLSHPENNWEDFGMVLYDRSQNGWNPKEAQAIYESLKKHRQDLGLSQSDLESKLIIVNVGAEVDSSMLYNVRPKVLLGITQVYQHEVLEKVGEDTSFDGYGLNGGLPLLKQLGSGSRTLYIPGVKSEIGLRLLFRGWDHDLVARGGGLAYSGDNGRVNFAFL